MSRYRLASWYEYHENGKKKVEGHVQETASQKAPIPNGMKMARNQRIAITRTAKQDGLVTWVVREWTDQKAAVHFKNGETSHQHLL